MENIYLVGFMGTGKTSTGRELAKALKRRFADIDELIELKEKKAISDIFAHNGELYFRKLESRILKEASKEKGFVFACGGGIVIDPLNIKIMKESGLVVCLCASVDVILKRTSGNKDRPLLNVPDPKSRIHEILTSRQNFYKQADFIVDTSKLTVKQAAEKIKELIKK